MTFGERLTALREERGIKRPAFAEMLGIPYTTLRNYEKDKREPGSDTLIIMSRALNVSVDYLIGIEDNSEDITPLQAELIDLTANMSDDDLRALIAIARRLCDS